MRTSSCDVGGAGWLLCTAIAFAQFGRSAALTTGKISWSGGPSNYYGEWIHFAHRDVPHIDQLLATPHRSPPLVPPPFPLPGDRPLHGRMMCTGCERFSYSSSVWCDSGCSATLMTSCPDAYGRCQNQYGSPQCGDGWYGSHYACMCVPTPMPTTNPTPYPTTKPTSAPTSPTSAPTTQPTLADATWLPTSAPSLQPTALPTESPTMLAAPVCKQGEILIKTTTYSYGGEISWTLGAEGAPPACNGSSFKDNDYAYTCCPVLISPASCKTDLTTCKPIWLTCRCVFAD